MPHFVADLVNIPGLTAEQRRSIGKLYTLTILPLGGDDDEPGQFVFMYPGDEQAMMGSVAATTLRLDGPRIGTNVSIHVLDLKHIHSAEIQIPADDIRQVHKLPGAFIKIPSPEFELKIEISNRPTTYSSAPLRLQMVIIDDDDCIAI